MAFFKISAIVIAAIVFDDLSQLFLSACLVLMAFKSVR